MRAGLAPVGAVDGDGHATRTGNGPPERVERALAAIGHRPLDELIARAHRTPPGRDRGRRGRRADRALEAVGRDDDAHRARTRSLGRPALGHRAESTIETRDNVG